MPNNDPIEYDIAILQNVYDSLKSGGKFLLTVLSVLERIKETTSEDIMKGSFVPHAMTFFEEIETPNGKSFL
ncbi:hypothetical protein [Thermosipho melanesiensis]|uniref:Uncharacterized protein n=2 Tax=Thermosipho melanesiensis TaxID=46541 RepID=A6LNM1_THEM4|nr:hypothetical protein [Thermosipho melanesiensis]ABR31522.1 hypothetical protein Tmel_1679 [Thermosipho melanesiensis BI429]APT74942.1 hypothetical protein BW47_08890 [Thermosipho melanesiensis]